MINYYQPTRFLLMLELMSDFNICEVQIEKAMREMEYLDEAYFNTYQLLNYLT